MKYLYIVLICLLTLNISCMQSNKITTIEKTLIMQLPVDSAFDVLLTTNETDSIFLREKSRDIPVDEINTVEIQTLIKRMEETLVVEEGVGLASPQIGIQRNLFLFMRLDKPDNPIEVAINPVMVAHSEKMICFEGDGCLSIPGERGTTSRYDWIDVEYYNSDGVLIQEKLHSGARGGDFTGVIFQHEFDHLNGILFIDRLVDDLDK